MSPEAQRIAIAEACGFTQKEPWLDGRECWGHKDHPPHVGFEGIPDYLNDINAMHEAVHKWLESAQSQYIRAEMEEMLAHQIRKILKFQHATFTATAAHLAEAYLRTLNLWQESPTPTP